MENRVKTILLWTTILILCFIGIPIHLNGPDEEGQLTTQFNNFTQTFGKTYQSEIEKERRFAAFKKSLKEIRRLNEGSSTGKLLLGDSETGSETAYWKPGQPKNMGTASWGITPFADLSTDEFRTQFLDPNLKHHIERQRNRSRHHHAKNQHPADGILFENLITKRRKRAVNKLKVDWRTKGIITPIKQQKSCGACWAFSTVETVESMHALSTGDLQLLSVQQVIDCSRNGNLGCNGGDTCTAIEWMTGRQLAKETEYPTTLKTENCLLHSASTGVRVSSNYSCKALGGNENSMLEVLENHGPVTVAVDATNWQYYVGGIIQWNCDTNLNHAVQIVGYDKTGDVPHYIVRNSWGTGFGDKGYLYVAIGSNLCGIASHVAWLSVS